MASYGSFLLCASLAFVVGYIDADSELKCQSNAALRGFESDRPFFKRVATPLCYNFGKPVCKGAQVHSSNVAGSSLSAGCPDVAPIIQNVKCAESETLAGFYSSQPFFKARLFAWCNTIQVCEGQVDTYNAKETETTLSAGCQDQKQIIQSVTIGADGNGNPTSLSVQCCTLTNNYKPTDISEPTDNRNVDCGENKALKKIVLNSPGNNQPTTARVTCVKLEKI